MTNGQNKPLPKRIGQFVAAAVLHVGLPLCPLFIEANLAEKGLGAQSVILTAAMYPITMGIAANDPTILMVSILPSLAFTAIYGFTFGGRPLPGTMVSMAWFAILATVVMIVIRRFHLQVIRGEDFISFSVKG